MSNENDSSYNGNCSNIFLNEEELNSQDLPIQNSNNSIISDNLEKLNYDSFNEFTFTKNNEITYVPQQIQKPTFNKNFFYKGKPKTSLDYLKINSTEYKYFQMQKKVKNLLRELNLSKSLEEEICHLSYHYSISLNKRKKLSTIVPIILYKLLKKYNNKNYTLKDLKQKINFKYKTYFRNEKLFQIFDQNQITLKHNLEKENTNEQYIGKVKNELNKCFLLLKSTYHQQNEKYGCNCFGYRENGNKRISLLKHKTKRESKKSKNKIFNDSNDFGNLNCINTKNYSERELHLIIKMSDQLIINEKIVEKIYIEPVILELENCQELCIQFINDNSKNINISLNEYKGNNETSLIKYLDINEVNTSQSTCYSTSISLCANLSLNNIKNMENINEKEIIVEHNKEETNYFAEFFKEQIDCYSLAISLIKFFVNNNEKLRITYKTMEQCFNIQRIKIKKGINLIKSYISNKNNSLIK